MTPLLPVPPGPHRDVSVGSEGDDRRDNPLRENPGTRPQNSDSTPHTPAPVPGYLSSLVTQESPSQDPMSVTVPTGSYGGESLLPTSRVVNQSDPDTQVGVRPKRGP